MADTYTYNQGDIQRYLQQQMTKAEMHGFEKAMMQDPFLADAVEGFQQSEQHLAGRHLQQIEEDIIEKKEGGKVVPMISSTRSWLRIAALFIVIAGVATLAYYFLNTPGNSSLTKEMASNTNTPQPKKIDSVSAADKPLAAPNIFPEKSLADNTKPSPPVIKQEAKPSPKSNGFASAETEKDSKQIAMNDDNRNYKGSSSTIMSRPAKQNDAPKAMQLNEQEFKGRVVDEKGEPLASVTVNAGNNINAITDANGNFTIKAADTVLQLNLSSAGYMPATAVIKNTDADKKIVLNENNELRDVVAETNINKKGKREVMRNSKNDSIQNLSSLVQPVGGWDKFNSYIVSKVKHVKDTTGYEGDVELEFTIDERGNPAEIKTINSSNQQIQSKAIEILQEGPKWKSRKKNAKGKVVIKF